MNTNMEQIMANFRSAFQKVISYRVLVTSPAEKIADLPMLVLLLVLLMSPGASVLIAIIAVVTGHRFRIEKDYIMRT